MLLGPIFRAELLRTARRRRYYVMRLFYGMLLLFVIWTGYESATRWSSTITIDKAAEFAFNTFATFAVVQLITILVLIPALFGGAIADEKQRKTLHYLMASRLSSFEIVVDKVLGRAPHVAVFLALGLPVVCLLGLIGGVAPEYVVVAYVGTFATATMAVALTVLVSTLARRVRQAVLIAYVLVLAWQFVPIIVYGAGSRLYPVTYRWIEPIVTWVGATSPLYVFAITTMRMGRFGGWNAFAVEQFAWMVGLQLGSAAFLILLAVWRLRPAFRRHEATQPRRKWFEGREKARKVRDPRWWDRPECGDDAMAWKERYFARTDVLTKLVVLPATVFASVLLVLSSGIDESIPRAFTDLWERGIRGWGSGDGVLADHVRVVSAWYTAIWLLAIAGASASSVAVEREEDTWVSLTSTPLTGWEILKGKVLGAVWAQRGFAAIPLGLWTIGLLTGEVHPLGFLGTVVAFGLVSWMVVAVGIHASLKAASTSKALASTITTLAILYGYPLFLLMAFRGEYLWDTYAAFVGLPPRLVVAPLVSYGQFSDDWTLATKGEITRIPGFGNVVAGGLLLVIYVLVATLLTAKSVGRFDHWLDRPRLSNREPAVRKPAKTLEEVEAVLQS
jgi:ABC-type transport system involved in multi-copper enzyme maturation permease subunit